MLVHLPSAVKVQRLRGRLLCRRIEKPRGACPEHVQFLASDLLMCAGLTGDMPIVLMFDGPSLGGFVCPATITSAELWKMGQVYPKDSVVFKRLTLGARYPP